MSVSVTCDPLFVVLLRLDLYQSCCDNAYGQSEGIWMCSVILATSSAQGTGERNGRPDRQ